MRKRGVALFLAALMVWTLAVPAWAQVNPFSDLESDHWAYEAVVTLAAAGLIEGYPDGTFGGDRTFTRYEMAMVFARILARFERLIDQKIEEGIDVRTSELADQIQQTRNELTSTIQSNRDELSASLESLSERLDAVEGRAGANAAGDDQTQQSEQPDLTPEAEAALTDVAESELAERLDELATKADVEELAKRIASAEARIGEVGDSVAALQDDVVTEDEARAIANLAIADALATGDEEFRAALEAAEGDPEAVAELVGNRVAELSSEIDRLSEEFRPELERLGVQVAELEERMLEQEATTAALSEQVSDNRSDIDALKEQVGDISFSGKSETTWTQTAVVADPGVDLENDLHKDPRDEDSDVYEPGNSFESKLTLGIEATPAENVDVKAELVLKDILGDDLDDVKPGLNLDVTTPGVLRLLHVGDLDEEHISAPFDKYTATAEKIEDEIDARDIEFQGANVDLVFGFNDSTSVSGFGARLGDADHVFGAAASYTLSEEFDFTLRGVKQTTTPAAVAPGDPAVPPESDAAFGLTVAGALNSIDYSTTYVTNEDDTPDKAIEAEVTVPLRIATADLRYAEVGELFDPLFAKELDSNYDEHDYDLPGYPDAPSEDWLDRKLSPPEDWVEEGETDVAATLSIPLLGVDTAVTVGRRTDSNAAATNDNNTYTQLEVGPVHFAGLDTSLLYDRRTNLADELDNTVRATVGTSLAGVDVAATLHNRSNEQAPDPNEQDQRSTWLTASKDFNLLLPITLDARYAVNQALSETSTRLGVSTQYPIGSLLLTAGYSTEQNALGDADEDISKRWWKNAEWAGDAKRDIATVGARYTLRGVFGTDIDTGYEYRVVTEDNVSLGAPRNTFTASFEKVLRGGEATLTGEGKYVTGGIPRDDGTIEGGNDRDLSAKLTLTYPIFEGGDLKIGGEVVNSLGDNRPEYNVYHLNAGLTIEF